MKTSFLGVLVLAALCSACSDESFVTETASAPSFVSHFYEAQPVSSREARRANVQAMTRASYELREITNQPSASLADLDAAVRAVAAKYGEGSEYRFARTLAAHYALDRNLLPSGLDRSEQADAVRYVKTFEDVGLVNQEALAPALEALEGVLSPSDLRAAVAFALTPNPEGLGKQSGVTGAPQADAPLMQAYARAADAQRALEELAARIQ